jgi:hypothetical protein
MPDRVENLRFTLKHLFIIVALLAVALSAARITGSIALSIHLTLLVIGWIMYRFMCAHLAGLIPCLLGFDYFAARGIGWAYFGFEGFFDDFLSSVASLLVLVGSTTFLYLATCEGPESRWQLANAAVFFVLFVAWWLFIPSLGTAAVARRQANETAQNNAAMVQAVTQVEAIRGQLGRIPTEDEINERFKDGLPRVRDGLSEMAIRYDRINDHKYQLWFTIGWGDINHYDSSQPKKGWQVEPF